LLLNVGPTHDGRIVPVFEERLLETGKWLSINGEAIYGTKPWSKCQNDSLTPAVWYKIEFTVILYHRNIVLQYLHFKRNLSNSIYRYTSKGSLVYAIFFEWPKDHLLVLGCVKMSQSVVRMLGFNQKLKWRPNKEKPGISVDLLPITFPYMPSNLAWTLKLDDKPAF